MITTITINDSRAPRGRRERQSPTRHGCGGCGETVPVEGRSPPASAPRNRPNFPRKTAVTGGDGAARKKNFPRQVDGRRGAGPGYDAVATPLAGPGAQPHAAAVGELFRKVTDLYAALSRPVGVAGRSALRLELANGSRLVSLLGSEGTSRGYSGVSLLIIDEAARVPDQ